MCVFDRRERQGGVEIRGVLYVVLDLPKSSE